ncbi:MAG: DNA recombination protein RmuC [Clostridia bacterium]|nr:DNA recombination protein RmuC [Clostridia bacterium]
MENYQFIILLVLTLISLAVSAALLIYLLLKRSHSGDASLEKLYTAMNEVEKRLSIKLEATIGESARDILDLRSTLGESISMRMDSLSKLMEQSSDALNDGLTYKQESMNRSIVEKLEGMSTQLLNENTKAEQRFKSFESTCAEQLRSIESALHVMRETNETQLDSIRGVVNEKLQQTLNERLGESFKRVEERLTEVYKGLGEMQALASGVGDLKKVLSNVKTRGTLGEIQLGAILGEVLAPEQYELNFDSGKGGNERVEFAIKLPNDGSSPVYLPIDSKFPSDIYIRLCDAYDSGDAAAIETSKKQLRESVMKFGKDIHDKYINPPRTTNFAIMFLPTEGLYAEAVRMGLIEQLQAKYRINLAGPSTMAALLNSLQMGFRTLAIQKRSSEVWNILARIKKEFKTFDDVLASTKKALDKANADLDKLVGVRTKQILRALNKVEELPADGEQPHEILGVDPMGSYALGAGEDDE